MIPRYEQHLISTIWRTETKVAGWDDVETATIDAREQLGMLPDGTAERIGEMLRENPLDLEAWYALEKLMHHDLGAYVRLRQELLPPALAAFFHEGMTSYDTEDPQFARVILDSCGVVSVKMTDLLSCLARAARRYRFTPMVARSHGQWAKLATFGGTIVTWYAELQTAYYLFLAATNECRKSRLSGAVGNYGGGLSPEIERIALARLRLEPYYGATQIMTRVVYAHLAHTLANIMSALENTALGFRLGTRSGYTLWQEPFGTAQIGSSAMPQKRNPIITEQVAGMARMARTKAAAIAENIVTWERRDISQSCVERVEWPDLFHILVHTLTRVTRVIEEMPVYPQTMRQEILATRGTYAADEAKNFLAKYLGARGIPAKTAYGILQLACFNEFAAAFAEEAPPTSLEEAQEAFDVLRTKGACYSSDAPSIEHRIRDARLEVSPKLAADADTVGEWNAHLRTIFAEPGVKEVWKNLFSFEHLLREEQSLFERVLGEAPA